MRIAWSSGIIFSVVSYRIFNLKEACRYCIRITGRYYVRGDAGEGNGLAADTAGTAQQQRKGARIFKPLDWAFIALSVAAAVISVAAAAGDEKASVLVVTAPSGEYRYALDKNVSAAIGGALGDSVIAIENGRARFIDSPCDNKLCVLHAPLSDSGHWSACLPNQIMLRIEGNSDQDIDIFTN